MRATDDRYRDERERLELALQLIRLEARTGTIRHFTGLSDDRIRRLYASYFKHRPNNGVRRRRGRTPSQIGLFVKSPHHRFHAATLAGTFLASDLLPGRGVLEGPRDALEIGRRLCQAYQGYLNIHREALLSLEWAWNLLRNLRSGEELTLHCCRECGSAYVHDALALNEQQCPACLLLSDAASGDAAARPDAPP